MVKGIGKKRGNKNGVELFVILLSILLILLAFVPYSAYAETATGSKVTYKGAISSMGSTCGKFTVKGYDAFCADHSAPTPPTGTKITGTKVVTKAAMRKALYYGYGGPKAKVSKNNAGWVSTSIALSRANGNGGGTSEAQKFYKNLKNYDTPPDSFKVYYCTTSGNKQDLCYWIYKPEGKLRIKKESTDANATTSRGYALTGAVYGVYQDKACTSSKRVAKLTATSSGLSNKVTLEKGKYYVKEITAPKGFALSSSVYTVTITDQCDKTLTVKDTPKKGKLQLVKTSAEPETTNGNANYSLAGAKYGIWSDKGLTKSVGVFTTKADGKSNVVSLLAGTYYVKETTAPKGYIEDSKIHEVKISTANLSDTKIINVKDVPKEKPAWVMLQKIDVETGEPIAQGEGTFAEAEFTVKYYEGTEWTDNPAEVGAEELGEWVFTTNDNGYVSIDEPPFSIGTITIQETKAPKGYVRNDEIFMVKILNDEKEEGVVFNKIPTTEIKQQPIRGDIEIVKTDSNTGEQLKGVTFEIINKLQNQVVATITTDENGYATTASDANPNGSLLYGTYIIRETVPPIGYLPMEDKEVCIDEHRETVSIKVANIPAEIKTNAYFKENGGKEIVPSETETIVDEVSYKNLIPGVTYRLKGILMDTLSGEKIIIDGAEVVTETEFTAEEASGKVDMEFEVKGVDFAGKSVTIFEYMYIGDTLVATHTDINDVSQTVTFRGVGDIEIFKGDGATGEPLEGVEFDIIDSVSGEVIDTIVTDEMGYATTANEYTSLGSLLYGDYIVRETEPLPGYLEIEDIEVTLDDVNRVMSLKIDNMPVPVSEESADTGDLMERKFPLLVAAFIISLMGILVSAGKRKI